jgi:hypothetical protein
MKQSTLIITLIAGAGLFLIASEAQGSDTFNDTGTDQDYNDVTTSTGNTLGEQNNNPGDIVYSSSITWQGQTGVDANGFVVFDTPQNGIRAMVVLLGNYYSVDGLNTVQGIIDRYAPPATNPTQSYVNFVCAQMGVTPNQAIDLTQAATMTALVNAMISDENGENIYASSVPAIVSANIG